MKKHLALILSLALTFSTSISIFANPINIDLPIQSASFNKDNSFTQNGLTYTITQNQTETLKGLVCLSNGQSFKDKTLDIPSSVTYEGKVYTVEAIAPSAFYQNNIIEKITIPNTVKNIGAHAFTNCQSLKEINVIPGANKYASINGVLFNVAKDTLITYPAGKPDKTYILPNNVKKIEQGAFYNNKNLEKFVANYSLEDIQPYAFANSQKLIEVSGIIKLKTLGDYAFANSSIQNIYLSTYLNNIGKATFYNSNLKHIEIPYRIESLPEYTFYNCKNLKSVIFKDGVNHIGPFAFANSGLENLYAPKTLLTIDFQAFANCQNLKNITFNPNLKTIKDEAFLNCPSLTSITIPKSLKTIGTDAFYDCNNIDTVSVNNSDFFEVEDNILYTNNKKELVYIPPKREISYVNIPKETESIKADALKMASSIDTFNVEEKNESFSSEKGILYDKDKKTLIRFPVKKSVINFSLPASIEKILPFAFKDATQLSGYISIPENTTFIGDNAFDNTPKIDGFSVSDSNKNYTSYQNILYNKDKTNLIKYPARKKLNTFTMLDVTKSIESRAFEQSNISVLNLGINLKNIEKQAFLNAPINVINIKEGVTSIEDEAFKGTNIKSIVLPSTLQNIGNGALSFCNNLKNVRFNSLQISSFGYNMFVGSKLLEKVVVPVNSYYNFKNYLINSGVLNWQAILQEYKPPVEQNNKNK